MNESAPRNPDQPSPSPLPTEQQEETESASIDSSQLLQNRREVIIRHGGETYRLRLTKSGKLILHK